MTREWIMSMKVLTKIEVRQRVCGEGGGALFWVNAIKCELTTD